MLGVVRLPGVNAAKVKTDARQRECSSEKCSHDARFMPVNEGGRLTASRLVVFYEVDNLIVRRDNDSSKNTKPT